MSSFSISLSGMNSAQKWLDNTAHNVANYNTENFKPVDTKMIEQNAGVEVKSSKSEQNLNINNEIVNLMQAQSLYSINAQVMKTQNQTVGALLNELA